MTLSKTEIKVGLEKLREEYSKLGNEFGEKFFSLIEFNRRFTHAEVYKIKMDAFLISELTFLEELKNKYDDLFEKKKEVSSSFDKIAKKNLEKWNIFPRLHIHLQADEELCYFYGAISLFYYTYTPIFFQHFSGSEDYFKIKEIVYNLERISMFRKDIHSPRIKDYQNILDTNIEKGEKAKQNILKDGAIYLKQCYSFLEEYIHEPKNAMYIEQKIPDNIKWENIDYIQNEIESLKNLSMLLVFQKSIGTALKIISSFSLQSFV